jgi:hypothetical protein
MMKRILLLKVTKHQAVYAYAYVYACVYSLILVLIF